MRDYGVVKPPYRKGDDVLVLLSRTTPATFVEWVADNNMLVRWSDRADASGPFGIVPTAKIVPIPPATFDRQVRQVAYGWGFWAWTYCAALFVSARWDDYSTGWQYALLVAALANVAAGFYEARRSLNAARWLIYRYQSLVDAGINMTERIVNPQTKEAQ